jgi:hypothetical protein
MGKIIIFGSFNYSSKEKNYGGILMTIIPHLQMPMLCLDRKSWMLGL